MILGITYFMTKKRFYAVSEILLVALIWSSSFVIIKMGLPYLQPLTLAGLRYFSAFLLLVPLYVMNLRNHGNSARGHWPKLFLMGLFAYPISNGLLYMGLQYIPAITGSFIFSMAPILILFLGIIWLKEIPTLGQVIGLALTIGGSILFFNMDLNTGEPLGIGMVCLGLGTFAVFGIMSRGVVKRGQVDTVSLSALPLGFGGGLLLMLSLTLEGIPKFSWTGSAIVLWLATINTSFAYLLYNHSLKTLTALEQNVILNLMPLGTVLFAHILLKEKITAFQVLGMLLVIFGVFLVQLKTREQKEKTEKI